MADVCPNALGTEGLTSRCKQSEECRVSTDIEKLNILLPHWIEHNAEHAAEFRTWAERAGPAGVQIQAAADHLEAANEALQEALERLGGPLEQDQE